MPPNLEFVVEAVHKKYGAIGTEAAVEVLRDVTFKIAGEEIIGLIGPSGCGKTTLLRIMAGLAPADSGRCLMNGEVVEHPRRDIGMVFQMFNLLPWRTALGNVEFGLELLRVPKDLRTARARRQLEMVGLKGFENHHPHQLSGGMQQRVGLARALAIEPSVLLMDEPFGSLDPLTAERLREELLKIQAETRTTIVIVTHNIDEVIYLCHRVIVISRRPGQIVCDMRLEFPEPRWAHNIQALSEFAHARAELKSLLGLRPGLGEQNGGKQPAA